MRQHELDFKGEADNIEKIATNFEKDPRVLFPVPVRELSTSRVLTTTFVEGKNSVTAVVERTLREPDYSTTI